MRLLIRLILNIASLYIVSYVVPGFTFDSPSSVIVAAIVIGIINTLIKPIVKILTLPITIVTLGLFAFVINVAMLWLASLIVPGFLIDSLWTAFLASLALSIVSWFLGKIAD